MNGLDLFSGIGGIAEALSPWVETVAYCENEPYAQAVLLSRMARGEIDQAPIWDDVTTLKAKDLPPIDIISGGFPCQDISIAGSGRGLEGKRSGLFSEIIRLVGHIRPEFIFLENVPAILTRGADRILAENTGLGYDNRASVVPAPAHFKDARRWFLLAKAISSDVQRRSAPGAEKKTTRRDVGRLRKTCLRTWESKPPICGMGHGVWDTNYRLRALGASVVPRQARKAFKRLMGL